MRRPHRLSLTGKLCLLAITLFAINIQAKPNSVLRTNQSSGQSLVFGGTGPAAAKAVVDTLLIMGPWGSGAPYNGQFQTPNGGADWNGWTSVDLTQPIETHWHVDTYHVISGTYSAWCGSLDYPSCGPEDPDVGGYGNNWREVLEWRGTVTNPAAPCTLTVAALVNYDTELDYDVSYLSVVRHGATVDLWSASGTAVAVPLSFQTVYQPGDYEGPNQNEVVVQFRFVSDGSWSDEDCQSMSAGALQVDEVQIDLSNGTGYGTDFEDGTLGDFQAVIPPGVGDFAKIWNHPGVRPGFETGNISPMVAFIDDGLVVPGTGGTTCITWCYGPDGYIVNNTGGLLGPDFHLHNYILSPPMALPQPDYEGAELVFDVWQDEPLSSVSAGMAYFWDVRSTVENDPLALDNALWRSRDFLYLGSFGWLRQVEPIGDLVEPGARLAQVRLGVYEIGFLFGSEGPDGSPAPYFDNVRLTSYPYYGPALSAQVTALPNDNFPASGGLDLVNLGANSVRFDMGNLTNQFWNVPALSPGDSVVVTAVPQRAGATLVGTPRMHWRLQANPLFTAAERTAGLGTSGYVDGWPLPSPFEGKFAFDLPDTGFLFPGDLLYYYFEATDTKDGVAQTVTLPADTTGYSNFADPMAYPPIYKMHALPSLRSAAVPDSITQPDILFWDDAGARSNRDEWYSAFANLGLIPGVDYDIYYTKDPRQDAGQGLGGHATAAQLAGYSDLIYTSGRQFSNLLTDPDAVPSQDPSNDVALLTAWFEQGDKDALLTGDDLIGALDRAASPASDAFRQDWLGVELAEENVLGVIGPQSGPLVTVDSGNPVFSSVTQWLAKGIDSMSNFASFDGSLATGPRRYDGVTLLPGAQRLAQFTDPDGQTGMYPYSAATLNVRTDFNDRIITFPYDFQSIWTPPSATAKVGAPLSTRAQVLADILAYFDQSGSGAPSSVPFATAFAARAYPNPFNPKVTIAYNMPRAGRLTVKVFDVRGRLIQTVADLQREAGSGSVQWDGRTVDGGTAAAGIYFYQAATGDQRVVEKIALIK